MDGVEEEVDILLEETNIVVEDRSDINPPDIDKAPIPNSTGLSPGQRINEKKGVSAETGEGKDGDEDGDGDLLRELGGGTKSSLRSKMSTASTTSKVSTTSRTSAVSKASTASGGRIAKSQGTLSNIASRRRSSISVGLSSAAMKNTSTCSMPFNILSEERVSTKETLDGYSSESSENEGENEGGGEIDERERNRMVQSLQTMPLFSGFDVEFFNALSFTMTIQTFQKGSYIVRKGVTGTSMYYLFDGTVNVVSADGATIYTELKSGAFFGEVGVLFAVPRTASIIATTNCVLYELTKDNMDKVLLDFPEAAEKIKNLANARLAEWLTDENYIDFDKELKFDSFWLRFSEKLEASYQEEFFKYSLPHFRVCIALFIAYLVFSSVFALTQGRLKTSMWVLRGVALAAFVLVMGMTYLKFYQSNQKLHKIVAFTAAILAGTTIIIVSISDDDYIRTPISYALLSFFLFILVPIWWWFLVVIGWINFAIYVIGMLSWRREMLSTDFQNLFISNLLMLITVKFSAMFYSYFAEHQRRRVFIQNYCLLENQRKMFEEKEKSDLLLFSIFPKQIANSLDQAENLEFAKIREQISRVYDNVTVLVADVVEFTPLSSSMDPVSLVGILNDMFTEFDRYAFKSGLEKIKTIGDCYVVSGGVPEPLDEHATKILNMGLDMILSSSEVGAVWDKVVKLRVGVHTGQVMGGVIGISKVFFDIWSDDVDFAFKMEASGEAQAVLLSEASAESIGEDFSLMFGYNGGPPRENILADVNCKTYFVNERFHLLDQDHSSFVNSGDMPHYGISNRLSASGSRMSSSRRLSQGQQTCMESADRKKVHEMSSNDHHIRGSGFFQRLSDAVKHIHHQNIVAPVKDVEAPNTPYARRDSRPGPRRDMEKGASTPPVLSQVSIHDIAGNADANRRNSDDAIGADTSVDDLEMTNNELSGEMANYGLHWFNMKFGPLEENTYFKENVVYTVAQIKIGMAAMVGFLVIFNISSAIANEDATYWLWYGVGFPILGLTFLGFSILSRSSNHTLEYIKRSYLVGPLSLLLLYSMLLGEFFIDNKCRKNDYNCDWDTLTPETIYVDKCCAQSENFSGLVFSVVVAHVIFNRIRAVNMIFSGFLVFTSYVILQMIYLNEEVIFSIIIFATLLVQMAANLRMELDLRIDHCRRKIVDEKGETVKLLEQKSDKLLLNVLPSTIAKRMKSAQVGIADKFTDASIMFVEVANLFSDNSREYTKIDEASVLHDIYSSFDSLCEVMGCEKIKAMGRTYMVTAGVPLVRADHIEAIAETALRFKKAIKAMNQAEGKNIKVRMGINSGAVVAGVIGTTKILYDIWGDSVNIASRMCSSCPYGKIQTPLWVMEKLRYSFKLQLRGTVFIKGKGPMELYFIDKKNPKKKVSTLVNSVGQANDSMKNGTQKKPPFSIVTQHSLYDFADRIKGAVSASSATVIQSQNGRPGRRHTAIEPEQSSSYEPKTRSTASTLYDSEALPEYENTDIETIAI
eukprot:Nk52_evm68s1737 gene=Nk52_evmTU68s1737